MQRQFIKRVLCSKWMQSTNNSPSQFLQRPVTAHYATKNATNAEKSTKTAGTASSREAASNTQPGVNHSDQMSQSNTEVGAAPISALLRDPKVETRTLIGKATVSGLAFRLFAIFFVLQICLGLYFLPDILMNENSDLSDGVRMAIGAFVLGTATLLLLLTSWAARRMVRRLYINNPAADSRKQTFDIVTCSAFLPESQYTVSRYGIIKAEVLEETFGYPQVLLHVKIPQDQTSLLPRSLFRRDALSTVLDNQPMVRKKLLLFCDNQAEATEIAKLMKPLPLEDIHDESSYRPS